MPGSECGSAIAERCHQISKDPPGSGPVRGDMSKMAPAQLRNHAGIIGAALYAPDAAASAIQTQFPRPIRELQ